MPLTQGAILSYVIVGTRSECNSVYLQECIKSCPVEHRRNQTKQKFVSQCSSKAQSSSPFDPKAFCQDHMLRALRLYLSFLLFLFTTFFSTCNDSHSPIHTPSKNNTQPSFFSQRIQDTEESSICLHFKQKHMPIHPLYLS